MHSSAEDDGELGLPAAPDVPRAPPVSYRHAVPTNAYAYPTTSEDVRQAIPRSAIHVGGESSRRPTDYHYASGAVGYAPRPQEPHQQIPYSSAGPQRRVSSSASTDRRKKLTHDRSPLQRLELTLDSMTKEEKRARMQAAEQRARQRQALRTGETLDSTPQQPSTVMQERARQSSLPDAALRGSIPRANQAGMERRVSTNTSRRYVTPENPAPVVAHAQPQQPYKLPQRVEPSSIEPILAADPSTGIPKRNLSFKDRAARVDPRELASSLGPDEYQYPIRTSSQRSQNYGRRADYQPQQHYSETDYREPSQPSQPAQDKDLPPLPRDEHTVDRNTTAIHAQPAVARAVETEHGGRSGGASTDSLTLQSGRAVAVPMQRYNQPEPAHAPSEEHPSDATAVESQQRHQHHISNFLFKSPETYRPGQGLYKPPQWLDEWKKATVGVLSGALLNVHDGNHDRKAWWEEGSKKSSKSNSRRKAEAFDGEYDDSAVPTRFKPPLYLKCGPLLRYTGIRREALPSRAQCGEASGREIWRGSVMIVTNDAESSYEIAPILRLFLQDIELLPSPPHKVSGDLPPEHVDPIAGHPKLGRRGETLYVRPVEHLEEGRDVSRDETDGGLFEKTRSLPDDTPDAPELAGSFASRRRRVDVDGERVQKYRDIRGFRLHAERGCTFWRFNIEIELRDEQQRVAYRINRGPSMGFWVPAQGQPMNIMFHSCNGFSTSVNPDDFTGPDPMWRDVLNNHQSRPFHVMVGGGDQIYNDCISTESELFDTWLDIRNPLKKHTAAFTAELQDQLEQCYLDRYCIWFSQGLFGLASSQIPMVNMYDDHDVYDGYGSYPHHDMNSPVMSGLGNVAFKYYMLFQQQTVMPESESTEPSWIVGINPGPYIKEQSRSIFVSLGGKVALLAVDTRTERMEDTVVTSQTWEKITNRLYSEVRLGQIDHLLVVLGVPIAYPRLVWLENILTSRLLDPVKALGKTGMFGKVLNHIDGGVEILDDLNDHWTAKNHKQERSIIMEDLQDLAMDKSVRITLLSGDVHLAAVGQFYSNPQLGLAKHKDPRYMPNIISSAIVNTPPPDLMADVLNKRNKVHHFDRHTDENMIPMFHHGVDGKPRNNKHLLPHRNWCSIRVWAPGSTPPPTPPESVASRSPSPSPDSSRGGGLFRRLSLSKQRDDQAVMSRESVRGPRPPVTRGGSIFRRLSRRGSNGGATDPQPGNLTRTMSLGSSDGPKRGLFGLGRRASESHQPEDRYDPYDRDSQRGHGNDEYRAGDDAYFSPTPPRRSQTLGSMPSEADPMRKPFHRTPTGLSVKQMKKQTNYEVDLEGGLDVCLNVEVNPKDPTGITVPYRLLVPRLQYTYQPGDEKLPEPQPKGIKRFLSLKKKQPEPPVQNRDRPDYMDDESEDDRNNMI